MADHPLTIFRETREPRLSRRDLALILGVAEVTVWRWEMGERQIEIAKLPKVVQKTGIPASLLRPDLASLLGAI